jgi:hypothetical protein
VLLEGRDKKLVNEYMDRLVEFLSKVLWNKN